ncbi:uncharacterized protein LOC129629506 isoform X2 [Bubalus kerabau]|uniref:uncharacterized protein LOC129629506 isoform X2 n=1 Tax=Bubalus carabanensis TaxID=3119969 RepID=UPI00244E6033|nr:uncharacterized protein LOC129629506 isoform X2 [Bubalus carabanensis]
MWTSSTSESRRELRQSLCSGGSLRRGLNKARGARASILLVGLPALTCPRSLLGLHVCFSLDPLRPPPLLALSVTAATSLPGFWITRLEFESASCCRGAFQPVCPLPRWRTLRCFRLVCFHCLRVRLSWRTRRGGGGLEQRRRGRSRSSRGHSVGQVQARDVPCLGAGWLPSKQEGFLPPPTLDDMGKQEVVVDHCTLSFFRLGWRPKYRKKGNTTRPRKGKSGDEDDDLAPQGHLQSSRAQRSTISE